MNNLKPADRPRCYDKQIALVLQGGGALGSYQAGVYESLADSGYLPDWIAGTSIGAINAAIIAGNAPKDRVAQLRKFWQEITSPTVLWPTRLSQPWASWQRTASALSSALFGQPDFFTPYSFNDWIQKGPHLSYYRTSALKSTLERLVDFERINKSKEMRFSVGAVNLRTGRLVYFDSAEITIRPEHVMASGALPPAFPPIEIENEHYWDGGLVSNTPLQYVLDYYPRRSRLTFQVDVFPGHGQIPTNLDEVYEREKDIRYSSRTRVSTDEFQQRHEVRHAINELEKLLPPEVTATDQAKRLHAFGCVTEMDIVQLIYRPLEPQGASKDFEFSRGTMNERWQQGSSDASTTLCASPWLAPKPREIGVRVFDVIHDILVERLRANDEKLREVE
ncbi:patatin-like phospholipase family protein [Bradyrhizobium sp.]|uniref:patatin-like phospholipase family protein n=1 Tax=Bradyrhizobium sp. TaxID=376 RepID=UPI002398D1AF|nr:patatin-like phospholipase family protein [Bradyrhizobium sp.]MDE1933528.1 patatin-like phospholipase family protein [Bradyrhizobium sp.]